MGIEKDVRNLKAEELEKRLAPVVIYEDTGEPSDPTAPDADVVPIKRLNPAGNEMGDSYDNRQDIVNEP